MGLLQNLAAEVLHGYFPTLDENTLRISLRNGALSLNDLHLNKGHIHMLYDLPLRLTSGTIGHLSLRIPWSNPTSAPFRLCARNVVLRFEEVAFPHVQLQVAAAILDAQRALKLRRLAESERAESAFARVLHKLLPILLDRAEVTFENVTLVLAFANGEEAVFYMKSFASVSASDIEPDEEGRGDLSKCITATGITARLFADNQDLIFLNETSFELNVRFGDGILSADFLLEKCLSLTINCGLPAFLHALQKRGAQWTLAARYARPTSPPFSAPRDWLCYATRIITDRRPNETPTLTVARARAAMHDFAEYTRLHVRRLQRGAKLRAADDARIGVLEDAFDADMILLLRGQARKNVLADEVSAFATKNWLSWALFSNNMSTEREQLAAEIRQSLSEVERRDGEDGGRRGSSSTLKTAAGVPKGWSRASFSVLLKKVVIDIKGERGGLLALHVDDLVSHAELDASMTAYSFSMSISDFVVDSGRRCICRRGTFSEAEYSGQLPTACANILEAKVQRPALDNTISVSVLSAPICLFVDLSCLPDFLNVLQSFNSAQAKPDNLRLRGLARKPVSSRPVSIVAPTPRRLRQRARVSIHTTLPHVEILISSQQSNDEACSSCDGVLLLVRDASAQGKDLGSEASEFSASCSFSLRDSIVTLVKPSLVVDGESSEEMAYSSAGQRVCFVSDVCVSLSSDAFALQIGSADLSLCPLGVRIVMCSINTAVEHFRSCWTTRLVAGSAVRAGHDRKNGGALFRSHRCEISHTRLTVRSDQSDDHSASREVVLIVKGCQGRMEDGSGPSASIHYLNMSESKYHGSLQINLTSRLPVGLSLSIRDASEAKGLRGTSLDVESTIGGVTVVLKPESLYETSILVHQFTRVFEEVFPSDSKTAGRDSGLREADLSSESSDLKRKIRLSALIQAIKLECMSEESRVLLRCQNTFLVSDGGIVSGSLDGLELTDLSGRSGEHNVAIKCVSSSDQSQVDRRRLAFTSSPTSTNIHLSGLQLTIMRPFVEDFVWLVGELTNSVQVSPVQEIDDSIIANSSADIQNAPRHRKPAVTVQGSALLLLLPFSPRHSEAACVEVSHITVTLAENSQVFSIRKVSLLTQGRLANQGLSPTDPSQSSATDSEWTVVFRSLDVDFSRHAKHFVVPSAIGKRMRAEWSIQFLSRAAVFIAPSQIRLLKVIVSSLQTESPLRRFRRSSRRTDVLDVRETPEPEENTVSESQPFHEGKNFSLETQTIFVELLNEDGHGIVSSAITSFEAGPVQFFSKEAREVRSNAEEVLVKTWSLDSFSVRVADKSLDSSTSLQEVVHADGLSGEALTSSPLGREIRHVGACLHIEGITRIDPENGTTSSVQVKFMDALLIACPALISEIMAFADQSMSDVGLHGDEWSTASSGTSEHCTFQDEEHPLTDAGQVMDGNAVLNSDLRQEAPVSKISIALINPVIRILEKASQPSQSWIGLRLSSIKTTLLYSFFGELLPGSQIRLKDMEISMCLSESSEDNRSREFGHKDELGNNTDYTNMRSRHSTGFQRSPQSSYRSESGYQRHSVAIAEERVSLKPLEHAAEKVESLGCVRLITVRLPSVGSNRIVVAVPSISIDSSLDSLIRLLSLATSLDVLPEFDPGSSLLLPPIQGTLGTLSVRVTVPTTVTGRSSHHCATIRIKSGLSLALARNASGLSAKVKVSADVVDEERGIRDQILSPCSVMVEAMFAETVAVEVSAKRLVRIIVSPLTSRAVAGLSFCLERAGHQSKPREEQQPVASHSGSDSNGLHVSLCLRGVVVCCVAEQPRVQLLRVVVRQVKGIALFPFLEGDEGHLEITVHNLMLEDTVSWRFHGDVNRDEESNHVQWTTLFSGMHGVLDGTVASRFPRTPGLHGSSPVGYIEDSGKDEQNNESNSVDAAHHHQTLLPAKKMPMLTIVAAWEAPLDHITAHVGITGFEINVNMAILPSMAAWAASIGKEVASVERMCKREMRSRRANDVSMLGQVDPMRIVIDHIAVEPMTLTVNTRAPPRPIQQTLARRVLTWILGSESATGLSVEIPGVVFSGDFDGTHGLVDTVQATYIQALASRTLAQQVIWQAPRFAQLARVCATALLRNSENVIIDPFESQKTVKHRLLLRKEHTLGLGDVIHDDQPQKAMFMRTHFETKEAEPSADDGTDMPTGFAPIQAIETLDITQNDGEATDHRSQQAEGREVFLRLRRMDSRLPKNERFELYVAFSLTTALLVTSHYLLYVSRSLGSIQEPIISRSQIADYHVTGARITVVSVHLVPVPVARRVARQQFRDTYSLAERVNERPRVSELSMHEMECHSAEYALWLYAQLPVPNARLKSCLY